MPPEMAKRAERLAKKETRTMSELVREALRKYEQPVSLLNIREYVSQIAPTPPAMLAMQAAAKRRGTEKLPIAQIDQEVGAVRRQRDKKTITTKRSGK